MVELHRSRFWHVTREANEPYLCAVRSPIGFDTLDAVQVEYTALNGTLDRYGRKTFGLLVDLRDGPLRSDPQFETVMRECRQTMTTGFPRTAVLVRSAVGKLQVARHAREDVSTAQVFEHEVDAIAHVRGS